MKRFCEVAFGVIVVSICLAAQPPATPASDDQITIKELVITGANDLSSSQIAEAKDSVVGKSGTTENLMDAARHSLTAALKSECYLNPDIELFSAFRKDEPPDDVVMHVTVREGLRYTLRNFRVQWAKAVSRRKSSNSCPSMTCAAATAGLGRRANYRTGLLPEARLPERQGQPPDTAERRHQAV